MIITVKRFKSDDDATLSMLYVDGEFECFGLEDEYRQTKVPKETRIPAGIYKMGVRTVGGFDYRYTRKFPEFHQGMLEIKNVPGFEYVLIHVGNTDEDTDGCLLVGCGANTCGELSVSSSVAAYRKLYRKVIGAALVGDLLINVEDLDR